MFIFVVESDRPLQQQQLANKPSLWLPPHHPQPQDVYKPPELDEGNLAMFYV